MGFTGKAAALIKLSFILAFNAMADALMDGADVVKRRQWLIDLNASSATAAALHGKGLAMRGIQKREIEAELSCLGVQFPLFPSSLLPSVVEFATMGRLRLH
jgi:phage regulator Rha-like protein